MLSPQVTGVPTVFRKTIKDHGRVNIAGQKVRCLSPKECHWMRHVTVDESVHEDERSDNEEKDENIKGGICQLLNQRTASQRRDKSCTPSH